VDYFDAGWSGLSVRVTGAAYLRQGRRTWTLTYRIKGKQRRMTLGTAGKAPGLSLAQARAAAGEALAQGRAGVVPQEAKAAVEAAATATAERSCPDEVDRSRFTGGPMDLASDGHEIQTTRDRAVV
jgi:hypothetical protein